MARRSSLIVALVLGLASAKPALAEEGITEPLVTGPGVGLDLTTGLIGAFAPVNLGLLFPKLGERVQLGIRASWSMPAINIAHEDATGEVITYLPWMIIGGVVLHVGSGVIRDVLRVYFGAELYAGSTFATHPGIIGDNVTIGANIFGGLELYLRQSLAIVLEGGVAGVFTLETGEPGSLGGISQHGATGFVLRFGPRFYFGRGA